MAPDLDNIEIFPWNDNLETGIAIIDEQHQRLVGLLNKLTNTLVTNDSVELNHIFNELAAYTKYHFETEEKIWETCFNNDPWLTSHHETHTSFLPTILEIKEEQDCQPLKLVAEHIIKHLIQWLALHIMNNDKRMAIVVKNVEAGVPLNEAKGISEKEMSGASKALINIVLQMYEQISSRTLDLMYEREERKKIEKELTRLNSELEKLATTDKLTGLFNRRHFDEIFDREVRRARRENRSLSLIVFDIDYFKKLNDHYGHVQGDAALEKIGHQLNKICRRPGDYAFRLGGEEFGILIANQNSKNVVKFAETIRLEIKALNIPNINSEIADHMTISAGVICKVPDNKESAKTFMQAADELLYKAKEKGRNQIIY